MSRHHAPETSPKGVPDARGVPVALTSRREAERRGGPQRFTIDCAECVHRETEVCDDCMVSFIVGHRPGESLVVDAGEARAVRLLEKAGLVPGVRHRQRAS